MNTPVNTDIPRREILPHVVDHPDNLPSVVECIEGCADDFGDRFDVLGIIPAGREYTAAGNLWTCDTYYLRDQFDGSCYVSPVRRFKPV